MASLEADFDYELVCADCGTDLGTFVRGEDFAQEPHACPRCFSRHLTTGAIPITKDWSGWETRAPAKGSGSGVHIRFLTR